MTEPAFPLESDQLVRVFLGLGSNIEPRKDFLRQAREGLAACVQIHQISSVYETEPWGYTQQSRFLNQVIEGSTSLAPLGLLHAVKALEISVGRTPNFRYGPRVIDIDILLYGEEVFTSQELTVPHAHILEREFVLIPFMELAPDLLIPGTGLSVRQAAANCSTTEGIERINDD